MNIIKYLNKIKSNNIISEIEHIKENYPLVKIALNLNFSNMTANILLQDYKVDVLKIFKIKRFKWCEIEDLMSRAGETGCELSIEKSDYPIIQKLIDKDIKKMFEDLEEEFSGYIVKQYKTKKQYDMGIGEYKDSYNNFSSAMTLANSLVLSTPILATNISVVFQNKVINIFNFEKEDKENIANPILKKIGL